MAKHMVLIIVTALGLALSLVLLWNCFWWPITTAGWALLLQQVAILGLLTGVIVVLTRNGNWLIFCFLLGAALMAQYNLTTWIYHQKDELTKPAVTTQVAPAKQPAGVQPPAIAKPPAVTQPGGIEPPPIAKPTAVPATPAAAASHSTAPTTHTPVATPAKSTK